MRTLKTLKPGQKGTKELLTRYGTSLLCVRYRYDQTTGERVKTVELIVRATRAIVHWHDLRYDRSPPRKAMVDIVAGASHVAGTARAAESAGSAESWPPPRLPSTFPQPLGKRFAFPTATAAPAAAVDGSS